MTLGNKIVELRKKQNLTQEQLSEKLGVTRQTLSNWEKDITTPDITQAKNIASFFKISLDDLTDNKLEINCSKKNILSNLIEKNCYLDVLSDDYNEVFGKLCTILEVNDEFVKFSFKDKNKVIEKLVDINLITSFRIVESELLK